jgi:hypothetical protein
MAKRNPLGVYVRQTPDWFLRRCATVGGAFWPSAQVGAALDLYNNAQDGSLLHVYRVFVFNDAGAEYGMTRIQGHGANHLMDAVPIVITAPGLPGQLWQDTVPAQFAGNQFPKDTAFSDAFMGNNVAGSMDDWHDDGPICVIPSGFSLRVYGFAGAAQVGGTYMNATFKYAVLSDQGT